MAFRNAFLAAVLATASATLAPNAASPALASEAQRDEPAIYDAVVVARYPHDPHAFTQGLLWHDGALYESTGRIGRSEIRRVDPATGEVLAARSRRRNLAKAWRCGRANSSASPGEAEPSIAGG